MNTHALEKVARYRDLATAQLRCARWETAAADPHAVTAYDAALEAVETATLALPADGTMDKQEHEDLLQQLVRIRDDIVVGAHEARLQ